jgi:hypothetical protein
MLLGSVRMILLNCLVFHVSLFGEGKMTLIW